MLATNKEIAEKYLYGWFLLDVIASALGIASAVCDATGNTLGRPLRPFLMLRLLKSGRWNRVPHMIREELSKHFVSAHFAERWSEILVMHRVGTFGGMLFYCVADLEASPSSWTYVSGIQDAEPFEQYMTSLYWAFATMTTVGYDDINCTTYAERIWGVFVLLAGAILFSFLVGKMGVLSSEMDANNSECRQMLNKVDKF